MYDDWISIQCKLLALFVRLQHLMLGRMLIPTRVVQHFCAMSSSCCPLYTAAEREHVGVLLFVLTHTTVTPVNALYMIGGSQTGPHFRHCLPTTYVNTQPLYQVAILQGCYTPVQAVS